MIELTELRKVLLEYRGEVDRAAEELRVRPESLYIWISKHGINLRPYYRIQDPIIQIDIVSELDYSRVRDLRINWFRSWGWKLTCTKEMLYLDKFFENGMARIVGDLLAEPYLIMSIITNPERVQITEETDPSEFDKRTRRTVNKIERYMLTGNKDSFLGEQKL